MKNRIYSSAILLIFLIFNILDIHGQSVSRGISPLESMDTFSISLITLECDYTSPDSEGKPMHYHWNISNRISPINGFNPVGKNGQINVVRPLGGKSRNDKKVIDEDTYKWDGEKYYYDWAPLKKQIDNVGPTTLYQLVTDNPPRLFSGEWK